MMQPIPYVRQAAAFLAVAVLLQLICPRALPAQVKNLYECPHGIVDGALGKCPKCNTITGNNSENQECWEAKDYIRSHSRAYTEKDIHEMSCGQARIVASIRGWKSQEDLIRQAKRAAEKAQRDADQTAATEIRNQVEQARTASTFPQFNSRSSDEQRNVLLNTDPSDLNRRADELENEARKRDNQATKARRNGDYATARELDSAASELRSQVGMARNLAFRAKMEKQNDEVRARREAFRSGQSEPRPPRASPDPSKPPVLRVEDEDMSPREFGRSIGHNSLRGNSAPDTRSNPLNLDQKNSNSSDAKGNSGEFAISSSRLSALKEILGSVRNEAKPKEVSFAAGNGRLDRFDTETQTLNRFDASIGGTQQVGPFQESQTASETQSERAEAQKVYDAAHRNQGLVEAIKDGDITRLHGGSLTPADRLPSFKEGLYVNGWQTLSREAVTTTVTIGDKSGVGFRNAYNENQSWLEEGVNGLIDKTTDGSLGLNRSTASVLEYIETQIGKGETVALVGHSEGTLIIKNAVIAYGQRLHDDPGLNDLQIKQRLDQIHVVLLGSAAYSEGMPKVGSMFQLYHQDDKVSQAFGPGAEPSGPMFGLIGGLAIGQFGGTPHSADTYAKHIKPYMWSTSGKAVIP